MKSIFDTKPAHRQIALFTIALFVVVSFGFGLIMPQKASAVAPKNGKCPSGYYLRDQDNSCVKKTPTSKSNTPTVVLGPTVSGDKCGGGDGISTSINIGCRGKGNPVMDLTFAIIRFLTTGVGLVLVGSMIYAGIQYTMSRGDPQATASAITRIRSNVIALLLFLFSYAILNYIIPGTFLK